MRTFGLACRTVIDAQTFDFLNALRLSHGSVATGILLVSGFEVFPSRQSIPFWSTDVLNFRMLERADLEALGIQGHPYGFSYTSLIVDMNIYLEWMHRSGKGGTGVVDLRLTP
jgi:hypothetical protein